MPPSTIKLGKQAGEHGSYAFYRSFQYMSKSRWRHVQLGKFFFVQVNKGGPICIGELQLVWTGRYSNHPLASIRLYYLPDQLPDGRQSHHGQDELVATEKMVLHIKDLIKWIIFDGVDWSLGLCLRPQPSKQCSCKASDGLCCNVQIMNFNSYCRLRTAMKRNEGQSFDEFSLNSEICAIYNLGIIGSANHVMFCKETFENPELENHEYRCDHLAPNLKGRPRKKGRGKGKGKQLAPSAAASVTKSSTAAEPIQKDVEKNGKLLKQILNSKDQFTKSLYKLMKDQGTPISKVPSLGFKRVDLFQFFKHAHNIGGYKEICRKRLWKHIYDRLGGNPHNTSAATCTKRHYERLLLAFEKYVFNLKSGGNVGSRATGDNSSSSSVKPEKHVQIKEEPRQQQQRRKSATERLKKLEDEKKSLYEDSKPPSRTESPLDAEDHIPLSMLTSLKTDKCAQSKVVSLTAPSVGHDEVTDASASSETPGSYKPIHPGMVAAKATWSVPQASQFSISTLNKPKLVKQTKKLTTKLLDSIPITLSSVGRKTADALNTTAGSNNSCESSTLDQETLIKAEPKAQPETLLIKPAHCVLKAPMPLNVLGPCHPEQLTAAQQSPWKIRLYNKYPDPAVVESEGSCCKLNELKRAIQDDEVLDLSAKKQKMIPAAHGKWQPPGVGTCGAIDLTVNKNQPLSLLVQPRQQQEEPLNFSTTNKQLSRPPPLLHRDQVRKVLPTSGEQPPQQQNYTPLQKNAAPMQLYMPSKPTISPYPPTMMPERNKISPSSLYPHRPTAMSARPPVPRHPSPAPTQMHMAALQNTHMWSKQPQISHRPTSMVSPKQGLPAPPTSRGTNRPHTYIPNVPSKEPSPKGNLFIDLTRDQPNERIIPKSHPQLKPGDLSSRQPKPAHSTSTQLSMHSPKHSTSHYPMDMSGGKTEAPRHDMARYEDMHLRYSDSRRVKQERVSWPSDAVRSPEAAYSNSRAAMRSDMLNHRANIPHKYTDSLHRHGRPAHTAHTTQLHSVHRSQERTSARPAFSVPGLSSPRIHTSHPQQYHHRLHQTPILTQAGSQNKQSVTHTSVPHMQPLHRLPERPSPQTSTHLSCSAQVLPAPPRLQPIPSSHRPNHITAQQGFFSRPSVPTDKPHHSAKW